MIRLKNSPATLAFYTLLMAVAAEQDQKKMPEVVCKPTPGDASTDIGDCTNYARISSPILPQTRVRVRPRSVRSDVRLAALRSGQPVLR